MRPAGVKPPKGTGAESPRAWLMWVLGLSAYAVAVMQRTSLGVASLQATDRFSAGASLVSLFVVVQLLTYAGMQVPVGVLADRFGTRVVVGSGAVLMCLGQLDMAFSTTVVSAIVSRLLVGAGDAMTLGAVLRMLPAWFRPQRLAVLNQLTGMVGQFGQVLSSVPLAAVLGVAGWTTGFVAAAAVSALTATAVFLLIRNAPPGVEPVLSLPETSLPEQVRKVLRVPATLLGFWIHWMCSVWLVTFSLMWGYPFIVSGLGYPQPVAAGLFTLLVLAGIPFGPLIGALSGRAPLQRTNLALLVSAWVALAWVAILVWPGPAPIWLLVLMVLGMGASGPGSSIGFDVVRASNPLRQIGTATGVVIIGGFLGGLLNVWVVGIVLDLLGGYSPVAFRWAMATQLVFWAVGVAGAYTARKKARQLDRVRGVRHPKLGSVLKRELQNWLVRWRLFRSPESVSPSLQPLQLTVDDGRTVEIAAVLPSLGGELAAIDVIAGMPDESWWHDRVADYLDLVGALELEIGSVEVRCEDSSAVVAAEHALVQELSRRNATLAFEVRPTRR